MNHKYKVLVTDMDGTLLNENKELPDYIVQELDTLMDEGIAVVLATGRMTYSAETMAKKFKNKPVIISYQGAEIELPDGKKIKNYISCELINDIARFVKKYDLHIHTYGDNVIYGVKNDELLNRDPDTKYASFKKIDDFETFDIEPTGKIFCVRPANDIDDILTELIEKYPDLYIVKPRGDLIEITEKEANKADAISLYCKTAGMNRDDVVCVGDSLNDIQMIEWAGVGVAVGNANPQLKSVADLIVTGQYTAGVLETIDTLFKR